MIFRKTCFDGSSIIVSTSCTVFSKHKKHLPFECFSVVNIFTSYVKLNILQQEYSFSYANILGFNIRIKSKHLPFMKVVLFSHLIRLYSIFNSCMNVYVAYLFLYHNKNEKPSF